MTDHEENSLLKAGLSEATFNRFVYLSNCAKDGTFVTLDVKIVVGQQHVASVPFDEAKNWSLGNVCTFAASKAAVPRFPKFTLLIQGEEPAVLDGSDANMLLGEVSDKIEAVIISQGSGSFYVTGVPASASEDHVKAALAPYAGVIFGRFFSNVRSAVFTFEADAFAPAVLINGQQCPVTSTDGVRLNVICKAELTSSNVKVAIETLSQTFADESKHVLSLSVAMAKADTLVARGVVDVAGVGQCAVTCNFVQVLKATLRDAGPLPAADCRTTVSKVLGNTSLADDTTLMPTDWAGEYVSIVAKSKDQVEQLLQSKSGVATHEKECGKYLYVAASSAALTAFLNDPAQRELERKRQAEAKERERLISDAKEKFGPIICECM